MSREINVKKTANTVDHFFKSEVEMYLARAGKHHSDLNAPQINAGSTNDTNSEDEKTVLKIVDYENKINAIASCLNDCTQEERRPYRKILKGLYVDGLKPREITIRIGYSDSQYRRFKRLALVEFANRITYWAIKYKTKMPDLINYKKDDTH